MTKLEFFWAALVASTGHLINAIVLGLIPVIVISAITCMPIAFYRRLRRWDSLLDVTLLFAIVGSTLGLILGASREPAVNAFLPAIISLIAGVAIYALPQEEVVKKIMTMTSRSGGDDQQKAPSPKFRAEFVVAAVCALMISSAMASFYGGSIRGLKEHDTRRYEEWKMHYERITIPYRAQKHGIGVKPAVESAK